MCTYRRTNGTRGDQRRCGERRKCGPKEDGDRKIALHHLPRSFRLLAHQKNDCLVITSRSVRTHRPRRSPGRDVKLRDAPRDGTARPSGRCIKLLKCASSSRVPSLGASRVMLQGVSRRARVAAAELARTRGERKMCRETENALFNDEDGAEFNDISHHIFTTVSVSRHISKLNHLASRSSLARYPPGAGDDSRDPPPRDENC